MIDLANLPDLDTIPEGELLALLGRVADDLEATTQRGTALYELRLDIYKASRKRTPPIVQRRVAEAAHVSEVAVIQTLRADRLKAEAVEAHDRGEHTAKRVRGCPSCSSS